MTTLVAPKKSLYEYDFHAWAEETTAKLKARDFEHIDLENLIEEIEGLTLSQRKEVRNRLRTLLGHLLKRLYVDMPDCFSGWENTIRIQRTDIEVELEDSPSLKRLWAEFFDSAWRYALKDVRGEYSKKGYQFPDTWQFSRDIDSMLSIDFWE